MRKLKFDFEKSKKYVISALTVAMLTTFAGCARDNAVEIEKDSRPKDAIETVTDFEPTEQVSFVEHEIEDESKTEEKTGVTAEKVVISSVDDINEALKYDNIDYLKIDGANIQDFSFLKNINVEMLQVLNNKYPIDMANVNSDSIKQIYLHNTGLKNQASVSNFKNLETYIMKSDKNNKEVTNLSFLSGCTKMQNVEIQNYAIENVEFAKSMKNLKYLTIYNSSIESLKGLENCSNLNNLSISRSKVSDISSLKGLNNLESVDLSDNNIRNVENISSANLIYLNLSDNYIKDVQSLSKNKNLRILDVSKNSISKFPASLVKDNISIDVSYNNISELSDTDKRAMNNDGIAINMFDNLLSSSTLREISNYPSVYFETNGVELSSEQAIQYNDKVKTILSSMGNNNDENVMRISKYIQDNCRLDFTYADEYKDNAYGALFTQSVCTGMTDLTNTLCRHLNMEVKSYHGDLGDPNDYERHVWSVCNGYHIDAMQSKAHKDDRNYPQLVFLTDNQMKDNGYILDANNISKCNSGKSDAERANIINNIESSKQLDYEER